jgi:hypothetical protein
MLSSFRIIATPTQEALQVLTYFKAAILFLSTAQALVNMVTELRYAMETLTKQPILVDTGQLVPKYTNRTYSDQQAEVANSLTNNQPN